MRYPAIQHPRAIIRSLEYVSAQYPDGMYGPARAEPFYPGNPVTRLVHRLRLAALVFVGRYDALDWQEE